MDKQVMLDGEAAAAPDKDGRTPGEVRFRFFRDLSPGQRLAVFKVFGLLPAGHDERLGHSAEERLLECILRGDAELARHDKGQSAAPYWLNYDAGSDVVEIHGIKYAHELFSDFAGALPEGQAFRIARRDNGVLCVMRIADPSSTAIEKGGAA